MRRKFAALSAVLSFTFTAIALSAVSAPAVAAPQILGLLATAEPVPLSCAGGICTAEISSVCLQQNRDAPRTGTAYRPAAGTGITLTVTAPDGTLSSLPVAAEVTVSSLRLYFSVKVSLPEKLVRRLGGGAAMLSIGPMASVVPIAIEDDASPLSQREIAAYTAGPLRATAERAFALDRERLDATRTLNQMINRLPENRPAGAEEIGPLLERTPQANPMAKRAAEDCRLVLHRDITPDLRSCLAYQHDLLATGTTNDVWKALKPGS